MELRCKRSASDSSARHWGVRAKRGDESSVLTPYFQIAVQKGLGERNATSPYHESLRSFYALPTKDWSIIFKPRLWGFLTATPENAYSFSHFILNGSLIWSFTILCAKARVSRAP
jgi:hypothetical protein